MRLNALGTDSKFEQLAGDLRQVLQKRDSVIVFTQYTDTMDYLRDKLRAVYGDQVACYSGRGGERWQGGKWVPVSQESVKTAFRASREVKILLCTESASEGLNLQTCGVLINYDMPWNPMRVEQRIGRIDRIGQTYETVWVRNYFYERTVEADIYHRLDDRIGSFEHVVGELQPILARLARAIEAAAMAGDERRERIIAQEVEQINQAVRSAEAGALDLDKLADAEVNAPAVEPPPLTLAELERTLVESAALGGRFSAHPSLARTHLLDWNGQMQGVTFDPAVYDDHPNTLKLLTYGSELLTELLAHVEPPTESEPANLIRHVWGGSNERIGWYAVQGPATEPVRALAGLREAWGTAPTPVGAGAISAASEAFTKEIAPIREREAKAAQGQQRSRVEALAEEIREQLLQAAYLELAQASVDGMYAGNGAGFTVEAVRNLRRHKIPFAGALKAVSVDGMTLSAKDPRYVKFTQTRRDHLDRRFESIKARLGELLTEYVSAAGSAEPHSTTKPVVEEVRVSIYQVW